MNRGPFTVWPEGVLDIRATELSGAWFSPCAVWRYWLWRVQPCWTTRTNTKTIAVIGLNPSTADERVDDPTIRRCIRFATDNGADIFHMFNAYAFRATDPRDMKAAADPVGPHNDDVFRHFAETGRVDMFIAAWGTHCDPARAKAVCEIINRPIHCLGRNRDGSPKHPLYLRADTKPELFWEP